MFTSISSQLCGALTSASVGLHLNLVSILLQPHLTFILTSSQLISTSSQCYSASSLHLGSTRHDHQIACILQSMHSRSTALLPSSKWTARPRSSDSISCLQKFCVTSQDGRFRNDGSRSARRRKGVYFAAFIYPISESSSLPFFFTPATSQFVTLQASASSH